MKTVFGGSFYFMLIKASITHTAVTNDHVTDY